MQSAWSRRKAAVAAEAVAEDRAVEDAVIAEQHEALAEKTDVEILEELGLPDPDAMVQGDDFKAFLSKTVPAHLRKRALRKLWRSNPVLACVDGLNDYDDDYLTGSYGQGPISTTYQVGKGMLSHLLEMERQKEALLSQIEEDATSEVSEEHLDSEEQEGLTVTQIDAMLPLESEIEMQEAEPMMPTPRRMTFHFEDDTP
ncbi:DUF3306 domain-containing protein [Planktomarina temperata]|nr:DUF3306 domain-containing protein [Planktomarina temperata]MDB4039281.1 DUF3306 domain-containing protein [Planktomarina temperata]MDB4201038.1 DUF3306 domain-containing protein [Planktomarina temperata]MDB9840251.1 DUF3306 domain-containing protein [Planktomarina temperata]MDC0538152.1 DUF3306 domain-containing protein [Planktomarina temperata]